MGAVRNHVAAEAVGTGKIIQEQFKKQEQVRVRKGPWQITVLKRWAEKELSIEGD